MLGEQPADEDIPPENPDDVNPNLFDYFGFGQPGQGPVDNPNPNPIAGPQVDGWGLWPEQPIGPHNPNQQVGEPFLELNDLQPNQLDEVPDLNMAPEDDQGGVGIYFIMLKSWKKMFKLMTTLMMC